MTSILRTRSRRCNKEPLSHLHVVVPEAAHRQAKVAAAKSGIPFKTYMAKLLLTAEPIGQLAVEAPKEPITNAAEGIAQQVTSDA